MTLWQRNLLLAGLALALAIVPLAFLQGAEWPGADTQSTEAIQELQPDYQPWFESLFSAADLGVEHVLFGVQALLGSLLVSGAVGWMMGRHRAQMGQEGRERSVAMIVAGVGVVVAMALFFVTTEFGEIQAFIAALQGVCIGLLGFFVGYPMGQRSAGTAGTPTAPPRAQV